MLIEAIIIGAICGNASKNAKSSHHQASKPKKSGHSSYTNDPRKVFRDEWQKQRCYVTDEYVNKHK